MSTGSHRDDWLAVIAVIVLLIGTATGNAYAMLTLSLAALVLFGLLCRKRLGSGPILVVVAASVTAFVISFVMAMH